jgi:hypothetical protein
LSISISFSSVSQLLISRVQVYVVICLRNIDYLNIITSKLKDNITTLDMTLDLTSKPSSISPRLTRYWL